MPIRPATLADRQLLAALNIYSLRKIQAMTSIDKNRLHRLRSFPLDTRLYELLRFHHAGLITLNLSCLVRRASR